MGVLKLRLFCILILKQCNAKSLIPRSRIRSSIKPARFALTCASMGICDNYEFSNHITNLEHRISPLSYIICHRRKIGQAYI